MAEITKTQLQNNIASRISDKTQKGSITKTDVATTLLELLSLIPECNILSPFSFTILLPENDRAPLPTPREDKAPIYCYCPKAGSYYQDSTALSVAEGETALLVYENSIWRKVTLNTLAQNLNNVDKNSLASQYLVNQIYQDLSSKLSEVKDNIPSTSEFLTNTQAQSTYLTQKDYQADQTSWEERLSNIENNTSLYSYELLSSQADGTNSLFTTTKPFLKDSTRVFFNGQRFFNGISYTEEENCHAIKISDNLPNKDDVIVIEAIFTE